MNKSAVKPNDGRRQTIRAESASGPGSASAADDHAKALRELQQLRDQLHPDSTVSPANARAALQRLDGLMPRLRDRSDSLFAMLYQSHAYYHLGQLDNQCAVLRRIRKRAGGTRLEGVIESYFGYGKCDD